MEEMKEMIAQARVEGKWLHCAYHHLWFSPDDLEHQQSIGKFRWGPVNWTLRDPQELILAMEQDLDKRKQALADVLKKVNS